GGSSLNRAAWSIVKDLTLPSFSISVRPSLPVRSRAGIPLPASSFSGLPAPWYPVTVRLLRTGYGVACAED
ncbi:hypothetical protein LSAT2_018050, partial [Lamellibrachia satsuma]